MIRANCLNGNYLVPAKRRPVVVIVAFSAAGFVFGFLLSLAVAAGSLGAGVIVGK